MKKLLSILLMLVCFSCGNKTQKVKEYKTYIICGSDTIIEFSNSLPFKHSDSLTGGDSLPYKYTVPQNIAYNSNLSSIEERVNELLIQYYKAGWMDASNGVIDLHNDNTLTLKLIEIIRKNDWRKIEHQVRSK